MQKSILKIVFGNILLGLAYAKLMVPNHIINGGVTSLSLIFSSIFKIDITVFTNGITIALLIIAYLFVGRSFLVSSIVSSLSYLLFFNVFYHLPFTLHTAIAVDFLLAVLLIASGYYCCLSENSSTAGLDVFAVILHRRFPAYSVGRYLRYINVAVLGLGYTSYGLRSVGLGIVFSVCFTKVMDMLMQQKE
ncbi:YitT family protein [Streptococcus respiraculi]|uniref:YitT family protein n=1 Tax=Streptococcus respiraculi TaxID=2021971 RepID=UPI000E73A8E9|nr:YitT family protein [Streptococcus respiraculi]